MAQTVIKVDKEVNKELLRIKIDNEFKSINEVIKELIQGWYNDNTRTEHDSTRVCGRKD